MQIHPTFALCYSHFPHTLLFTGLIFSSSDLGNLFSATSVSNLHLVCLKNTVRSSLSSMPSIIKCIDAFCYSFY